MPTLLLATSEILLFCWVGFTDYPVKDDFICRRWNHLSEYLQMCFSIAAATQTANSDILGIW